MKLTRYCMWSMRPSQVPMALARLVLALSLTAGALAVGQRDAHAYTSGVLYTPDLATYPNASAIYTWAIHLQHSGAANGTILATHADGEDIGSSGAGQPLGFPIYQSTDGGTHWSSLSRIVDTVHGGWQMFEPSLFELPQQVGPYPAGTLIAGGLAASPGGGSEDLEVYRSDNHGQTWTYMSSCATQPNHNAANGVYEPTFQVDKNGNLVCYFSDERQSAAGYSVLLGHVVSTDGGQTWGSEVMDIGKADGSSRPGMPIVIPLPNGQYFMVFELCDFTAGVYKDCEVHFKISSDGDSWGTPSDFGTRIQTSDGKFLGHTPFVAWSPAGGSNGTLIVSAMDLDTSSGALAPESGSTLMINTNLGAGNWSELTAPISVAYGSTCNGWRQALVPLQSGTSLLQLAPSAIGNNKCDIVYGITNVVSPTAVGVAVGPDNQPRILWDYPDGHISVWTLTSDGSSVVSKHDYGPFIGWSGQSIAVGADNKPRILWDKTDGTILVWTLTTDGSAQANPPTNYGPITGWNGQSIAVGADNKPRILWDYPNGTTSVWTLTTDGSAQANPPTNYSP